MNTCFPAPPTGYWQKWRRAPLVLRCALLHTYSYFQFLSRSLFSCISIFPLSILCSGSFPFWFHYSVNSSLPAFSDFICLSFYCDSELVTRMSTISLSSPPKHSPNLHSITSVGRDGWRLEESRVKRDGKSRGETRGG